MKQVMKFFLNRLPRPAMQRLAPAAARVAGLAYAGRGVECPVCGRHYRKFLPYGYQTPRENALCPGCLSLERHRLIALYLRQCTGFHSSRPLLLHVAPEACFIKRFGKLLGDNYVTGDLYSPLAKVRMDVRDIPFPDGHFDMVLCNHVLEHIDDDRRAMRELYRVLKPGGWGIVQVPLDPSRKLTYEDPSITTPEGRAEAFGQYDHYRVYGLDYADRLREEGFRVVEDYYAETLTREQIALYALQNEVIYRVVKG